jgi:hypothetical protein
MKKMADLQGFDATQVPPGSFDPLPPGRYPAVIVASEMKATKTGTGNYLEVVLEVIEGEHKGRRLWDRLNIKNPNAQAEQIAKATLSAICHAVGVLQPRDSSELHDLPLAVQVAVEQRDDTGQPRNVVRGYAKLTGPTVVDDDVASSAPPWKAE